MSLDAVKKVLAAEELAEKQREEAQQKAKKLIAEAEKEGAALLEVSRWEAEIENKKLMTEELQEDAKREAAQQAKLDQIQQEIQTEGRRRLVQAAQWILRRVVEG